MAIPITASGAQSIGLANAIIIQVNLTLAGTITVTTAGSAPAAAATIATITNPTVGSIYRYGGLTGQGAISVNPSGNTDITVSKVNRIH